MARSSIGALLFSVAVFVAACQSGGASQIVPTPTRPNEAKLTFETIEQDEWANLGEVYYEDRKPALMVIAAGQESELLDKWIQGDAKSQLQALDYEAYFAMVVFQGYKLTTGYGVQIDGISYEGDVVTVTAKFNEPSPDEEKGAAVTSPYHLVKVSKPDDWNGAIRFDLIVGGTVVASTSHRFS